MSWIVRLWKGDIRLVYTFWIFGLMLWVSDIAARYMIAENGALSSQRSLMTVILFLEMFFPILWAWCVWRSSQKYSGLPVWKWIARGYSICESLWHVFLMWMYLGGVH